MAGRVILMNVVIFFSALGWAVAFALPSSLVLLLLSGLLSSGGGMLFLYLLAMGRHLPRLSVDRLPLCHGPLSAHRSPGSRGQVPRSGRVWP